MAELLCEHARHYLAVISSVFRWHARVDAHDEDDDDVDDAPRYRTAGSESSAGSSTHEDDDARGHDMNFISACLCLCSCRQLNATSGVSADECGRVFGGGGALLCCCASSVRLIITDNAQ